jgi:hypothetical protein
LISLAKNTGIKKQKRTEQKRTEKKRREEKRREEKRTSPLTAVFCIDFK